MNSYEIKMRDVRTMGRERGRLVKREREREREKEKRGRGRGRKKRQG